MDVIFWGGLVRFCEAILAGAPTLLVGLVVAGVFRKLLGPDLTLKIFGGRGWRSLPQAWFWGMLLPVCSIGVIPVAYELRRAGLRGGAILAFALTAPLFNPLSILYGLTLSTPMVILWFALGALLVVTSVGFLWDWLFPNSEINAGAEPTAPPGLKRLASIGLVSLRHMAGATALYATIALSGSIVLAVIFPFGSLTDSMAHTDRMAPLEMLVVALPAYATPLNVMMQVGGMFVHGNSVGAAYVLLSLGTGANLGLIAWAWFTYGFKRTLVFIVAFISVVLAIAYTLNDPLYSAGNVEHPHTHAFDVYACPFPPTNNIDLPQKVWTKLSNNAQLYELIALSIIAAMFVSGMVLRFYDPKGHLEKRLSTSDSQMSTTQSSWMNVSIPGPILGVIAIMGLIAFSIVGCFIYFPAPDQALRDMNDMKVATVTYYWPEDVEQTIRNIETYDDLTRRLEVGYYLRNGEVSEYQQAKVKVLRGRLEQLKDILQSKQTDRVKDASTAIMTAHRRVVEAFKKPEGEL
ncbi:MAG: permease [Pirellulaceae bacterium]|nr:permease [Pirellulaceae bacterium]